MDDIGETLTAALADRYALSRIIGRGGMATVYLARDHKHGREVAVKVLLPEIAASIGTERFLNEIQIAARLTHPHIVPLYDSGEAAGFLFYVMPYVDGPSLRGLLNRNRTLDPATCISIASPVAEALEHAHRMGVLHRDIKPENILLAGGHAFVADFGVAKAISAAGGSAITRTGMALGTPGYMSPEQAAGVRDIDGRTDVYGLASVVYETLVGDTPGFWPTEEAVRLGRFVDATAEHREALERLPARVEQVLTKALAMRPADRYGTPLEFTRALTAACERGKKLTEARVRELLARASELQGVEPEEDGALSVAALESVAAQVGVPPERVREAIRDLGDPSQVEPADPMAPSPRGGRRYAGAEVERILARAVELDDRRTETGALSIGGVERLAAEVGIPPERVQEAASALERRRAPLPAPTAELPHLYGRSPIVDVRTRLDREVPDSVCAQMIEEVRGTVGMVGQVAQLGGSVTWSSFTPGATGGRDLHVSLNRGGGATEIRMRERVGDLGRRVIGSVAGWGLGGLCGLAIAAGLGLADTSMASLLGIGFSVGGAYLVSRSLFVQSATQRERELQQLADRLVLIGTGGEAPRGAEDVPVSSRRS